ncbi:protein FAM169B-like [Oratosquilla oratoria]|uniref:protein FAM169B-like n=1 Tax=Oratosquilla oratoria TaxID=337810 RepID=UPI003F76E222
MSGQPLTLLTDSEVLESITNISLWLETHSHAGPQQTPEEIIVEDLAIAIPGECLFQELYEENEEASREEEKGILVYTDSTEEKYMWLKGDWYPLETVLNTVGNKNGWVRTTNLGGRLLVLSLTQLDYAAREAEAEVPYGCCPLSDFTYLLWQDQRPIGMCSIKRKGTSIWGGEDVYACDTLDTLYVRPCERRRGHALSLLHTLALNIPPGEHLGLSHPVSLSMCKVLLKFIQLYPELRDVLWTLDEDGEVSGTVTLMLGSLMMRGALQGAGSRLPPAGATPPHQAQQAMEEAQQSIQQTQQAMEQSQDTAEGDEPCDTS